MKFSQKEILDVIKSSELFKSNDLARLFMLKKAENHVRDILTIELERKCEVYRNKLDLEKEYVTSVHETKGKKHDIAILSGIKKRKYYHFIPNTIIELKYTKADWIIINKDAPIDKEVVQDNIWKGNQRGKEENIGKEGGLKSDLLKLEKAQDSLETAIHLILVLTNPHSIIDSKFAGIMDGLHSFNDCLEKHNNNHYSIYRDAVRTIRKQLRRIQDRYLESRKFKAKSVTITVGEAFGSKLDLIFIVISEEHNT